MKSKMYKFISSTVHSSTRMRKNSNVLQFIHFHISYDILKFRSLNINKLVNICRQEINLKVAINFFLFNDYSKKYVLKFCTIITSTYVLQAKGLSDCPFFKSICACKYYCVIYYIFFIIGYMKGISFQYSLNIEKNDVCHSFRFSPLFVKVSTGQSVRGSAVIRGIDFAVLIQHRPP